MRWDIINHLIKKNNYKSYLEIGYYKGWSFDRVECERKIAVDPNPSKIPEQEQMSYGKEIFLKQTGLGEYDSSGIPVTYDLILKMTSDDFFSDAQEEEEKYDIIFIDGLHEASQVTKDIENSLKHLSEGGTIVLHDCNPIKYEHTTTGIDGCWTGDTYKAVLKFRDLYEGDYEFSCINVDWGVGIIQKRDFPVDFMFSHSQGVLWGKTWNNDWQMFDENRKGLLSLISEEEFLNKLKN